MSLDVGPFVKWSHLTPGSHTPRRVLCERAPPSASWFRRLGQPGVHGFELAGGHDGRRIRLQPGLTSMSTVTTVMTAGGTEDNGDIPKAPSYGPIKHGPYHLRSTIGDGPHGSSGSGSGDYDFFRITGLNRGWILSVDVTAQDSGSALDSVVVVYDSAGTILGSNNDFGPGTDSFLEVTLPADGDYLVDVHSFFTGGLDVLTDPFDSSTGLGVGTEGDYELTIAVSAVHP